MLKVCVYCASSEYCHPEYMQAAHRLGEVLARNSVEIVYGGGALGLMGQVANGALANGGKVIGIMPRFMQELEWAHRQVTELRVVENMRERKHLMLTGSDAVIALPGGVRHAGRTVRDHYAKAAGDLFESDCACEHAQVFRSLPRVAGALCRRTLHESPASADVASGRPR